MRGSAVFRENEGGAGQEKGLLGQVGSEKKTDQKLESVELHRGATASA